MPTVAGWVRWVFLAAMAGAARVAGGMRAWLWSGWSFERESPCMLARLLASNDDVVGVNVHCVVDDLVVGVFCRRWCWCCSVVANQVAVSVRIDWDE